MKVSEILKVVKECERLRDILTRSESIQIRDKKLRAEDKIYICDLLCEYRNDRCSLCELLKKEVE